MLELSLGVYGDAWVDVGADGARASVGMLESGAALEYRTPAPTAAAAVAPPIAMGPTTEGDWSAVLKKFTAGVVVAGVATPALRSTLAA